MKLSVRNKRLLLSRVQDSQNESDDSKWDFVLPDSVKLSSLQNSVYVVTGVSPDVTLDVSIGNKIIVEGNMVEETTVNDVKFLTVLQNHVIGIVEE